MFLILRWKGIKEEADEMDDLDEWAVTHVEKPVVNVEWDNDIDMTLYQELLTNDEMNDWVDKDVLHNNYFNLNIVKSKSYYMC